MQISRSYKAVLATLLTGTLCFSIMPSGILTSSSGDQIVTEGGVAVGTAASHTHTPGLSEVIASQNTTQAGVTPLEHNGKMRVIVQVEPEGHSQTLAAIKAIPSVEVNFEYTEVLSGASLLIDPSDLKKLDTIAGITNVERSRQYVPSMLGVDELVNGLKHSTKYSNDGSGMVIALVDSGLDLTHKDMRIDDGVDTKIDTITPTPKGTRPFTTKVPHGYNFINHSFDVFEDYDRPHGMHIAGILAGNARDEEVANNTGIDGIAPNAQLLMYRVFSDRPDTVVAVIDDKVYAAMEDAIKHGADVMSLSIGAYGTGKPSDAYFRAIKNAKDKGIVVAVSMGNAATSGSTTSYDRYANEPHKRADVATTVTGAANVNAIGVGSATHTMRESHAARLGTLEFFYNQASYSTVPDQEYTFVNAGKATSEDVANAEVNGKVAIISRSSEGFKTQFDRLRDSGAVGAIVYNNSTGLNRDYYHTEPADVLNELIAKNLWGMSVSYDTGQRILESIKETPTQRLTPLGMKVVRTGKQPEISGFSSWGSTVDLELKPDLVAPGEGILSTFNKDRYGTMSGTSMSTPVVAGAAALVLPEYRKYTMPEGMNIVDFTRIMMMNTARPLMDTKGVENSPRQQGAGMLNIQGALDSKVFLTSDNRGAATLKEIRSDEVSFTATLRNMGSTSQTFTIRPAKVSTSGFFAVTKEGGDVVQEVHSTPIDEASVASSAAQVTIPAGATEQVTFTLRTPGSFKNSFAEGYIYFESDTHPNLVLPFFGYKGDWQDDPIIDLPRWEKGSLTGLTALMSPAPRLAKSSEAVNILLGAQDPENLRNGNVNPDDVAISSASSNRFLGTAWVRLGVIRDLQDYRIDVVREKSADALPAKVVHVGNFMEKFRLTDFNEIDAFARKFSTPPESFNWNGNVYDPKTGNDVPAQEGQYYVRVSVRNDLSKPYQVTYLPVKVDNTAPTASMAKEGADYLVTASDNTKVWMVRAQMNDQPLPVTKDEDGRWRISAPQTSPTAPNVLSVDVIDIAGNYVPLSETVSPSTFAVNNLKEYGTRARVQLSVVTPVSVATLEASVAGTSVTVVKEERKADAPADAPTQWLVGKPRRLASGEQTLVLTAKDADGGVIATQNVTFLHDPKGPVVTLDDYEMDEEEEIPIFNSEGYFTLSGSVKDEVSEVADIKASYASEFVRGKEDLIKPLSLNEDGEFSLRVYKADYPKKIVLRFVDGAGNRTDKYISLEPWDDSEPYRVPFYTDQDKSGSNIFYKEENLEDKDLVADGSGMYDTTIRIFCDDASLSFTVNGGEKRQCGDEATSVTLKLKDGANVFNFAGYDEAGAYVWHAQKTYFVDVVAPTVQFDNLTISAPLEQDAADANILGTIYANSDTLSFTGTAKDFGLGWYLSVNNAVIQRGKAWREFEEEKAEERFSFTAKVADGDFLKLYAGDFHGNQWNDNEAKYRVKIDTIKPVVAFTPEEHYKPGAVVSPKVSDNIAVIETAYFLDGKPFDITTGITAPGAHTLRVVAKDAAQNVTDESFTVSVVGPPTATVTAEEIAAGELFHVEDFLKLSHGTSAEVTGEYNEGDSKIVSVELRNVFGETETITVKLPVKKPGTPGGNGNTSGDPSLREQHTVFHGVDVVALLKGADTVADSLPVTEIPEEPAPSSTAGKSVTPSHTIRMPQAPIAFVAAGFTPGEKVTFTVYSTKMVLGTVTADLRGVAVLKWTIPADFTTGRHHVTATNAAGEVAVHPFFVTTVTPGGSPTQPSASGAGTAVPASHAPHKGGKGSPSLAATGASGMVTVSALGFLLLGSVALRGGRTRLRRSSDS